MIWDATVEFVHDGLELLPIQGVAFLQERAL